MRDDSLDSPLVNEANEATPRPYVGAVVLYATVEGQDLAAIVTGISSGRAVNLRVFRDGDLGPDERATFPHVGCPQMQHARVPLTWRWPQQVVFVGGKVAKFYQDAVEQLDATVVKVGRR